MRNCGMGKCLICHKNFTKRSHNSSTCSDECRLEKDRRRDAKRHKGNGSRSLPAITNICEICGIQFIGRRPYHSYSSCGAPECRLEVRRRRGKARGKKTKGKGSQASRQCLKCDKSFLSPNGNRICPECQRLTSKLYRFVECWG